MDSEFPSNSRRPSKSAPRPDKLEPPKKVEKAIIGEVVVRKKPLGRRFVETFFGGDAHGVGAYLLMDVLIPAVKDLVVDIVTTGAERAIFGDNRAPSRRSGYRPFGAQQSYTQYNRYATASPSQREDRRVQPESRRARNAPNHEEIIFATRAEAQEVLDRLFDLISQYEQATLSELKELVGLTGEWTDENWGWRDIRGTGIVLTRSGYLLDLPRPEYLGR